MSRDLLFEFLPGEPDRDYKIKGVITMRMTQEQLDKTAAATSGEIARLTSNLSSMQRRIDKLQGNNQGGSTDAEPMNERVRVDKKTGTIRQV